MTAREKTEQTRQHIVERLDQLLYEKGFHAMSFSDMANASGVPRGNLYYYFKTKHDVLNAVITHRVSQMQHLLSDWETTYANPIERIQRLIQIPLHEQDNVIQYGCPMGSLNTELGKHERELQSISRQQFDVFKDWLVKQLTLLNPDLDHEAIAIHIMASLQGLSVIAHSYQNPHIIEQQVTLLLDWLTQVCQ